MHVWIISPMIFVISFLFMAKQVHGQFQGNNPTQNYRIDSLMNELSRVKIDSVKLKLLQQIGQQYVNFGKPDSGILFYQKALEQVEKMKMPVIYQIWQLDGLEHLTSVTGNYLRSVQYSNKALLLSEQLNDDVGKAFALSYIGEAHSGMGDLRKALDYYFKSKKAFEISESGHWAIQHIAETYLKMHMLDSASKKEAVMERLGLKRD
jgi:tetratricopeptide (TPR) repeat protein